MNIIINLNSTTKIEIELFKIMEKKLKEPIFDGEKHNFEMFSFYYVIKHNVLDNRISNFDLFKSRRLFYREFEISLESGIKYQLIRAITDDYEVLKKFVSKLKSVDKQSDFTVVQNNLELSNLSEIDEYCLFKFLDAQIDTAVIPYT